jgi:hypothetical protein
VALTRRCVRVGHLRYTGGAIRNILSMQTGHKYRGYHYRFCFKKYYETENNPYYTHTSTPALVAHSLANQLLSGVTLAGWLPASSSRLELVSSRHLTKLSNSFPQPGANKAEVLFGLVAVTQSQSSDTVIIIKVSHYRFCLVILRNASSFLLQCLFWKQK